MAIKLGCVGAATGIMAMVVVGPPGGADEEGGVARVREGAGDADWAVEPPREATRQEFLDLVEAPISAERLARAGDQFRFARMPDGKVHVRIANMWRLGTSDVPARLVAVPAYGGGQAVEWEIDSRLGRIFVDEHRPLVPRWRVIERPVGAYKRRTILLSLIKRKDVDRLVGACLVEMPGALEVPVARVSEPVDPTTIEREWIREPRAPGVRLRLPWPRGVFDAWLEVKAADGSSVWEGPVSRERMEYERLAEGDSWAADPARAAIYFPKEMPEGDVQISVRWLTEVP
jgi:hypothetical protein